eukprot:EG_transcript_1726
MQHAKLPVVGRGSGPPPPAPSVRCRTAPAARVKDPPGHHLPTHPPRPNSATRKPSVPTSDDSEDGFFLTHCPLKRGSHPPLPPADSPDPWSTAACAADLLGEPEPGEAASQAMRVDHAVAALLHSSVAAGHSQLSRACRLRNAAPDYRALQELERELDSPLEAATAIPRLPTAASTQELQLTLEDILGQLTMITSGELLPHYRHLMDEPLSPKKRTEEERAAAQQQLRQKLNMQAMGVGQSAQEYVQEKCATLRAAPKERRAFNRAVEELQRQRWRRPNGSYLDIPAENRQLAMRSPADRAALAAAAARRAEAHRASVLQRKVQQQAKCSPALLMARANAACSTADPAVLQLLHRRQAPMLAFVMAARFLSNVTNAVHHTRAVVLSYAVLQRTFVPQLRLWQGLRAVRALQRLPGFFLRLTVRLRIFRKRRAGKLVRCMIRGLNSYCGVMRVVRGFCQRVRRVQRQVRRFLAQRSARRTMLELLWDRTEETLYWEGRTAELQRLRPQVRNTWQAMYNCGDLASHRQQERVQRLATASLARCSPLGCVQHQVPLTSPVSSPPASPSSAQRSRRDPRTRLALPRREPPKPTPDPVDGDKPLPPLQILAALRAHELPDAELRRLGEEVGLVARHRVFFVPPAYKTAMAARVLWLRQHFHLLAVDRLRRLHGADTGESPRRRRLPASRLDRLRRVQGVFRRLVADAALPRFQFLPPASEMRTLVRATQALYELRRKKDFEYRMEYNLDAPGLAPYQLEAAYNAVLLQAYTPQFIEAYQQGANINTSLAYVRHMMGRLEEQAVVRLQQCLLATPTPAPDPGPGRPAKPWLAARRRTGRPLIAGRKAQVKAPPDLDEVVPGLDSTLANILALGDDDDDSPLSLASS